MRLHRFYARPSELELRQQFWVHDTRLLNQWLRVLRYRPGDQLVLFDGVMTERLYKIAEIEPTGAKLELVTEFDRKLPAQQVYLFFSLLKKDKNDWVLQKCTELGVSNFVPLLAERSEKTGFHLERAEKIVIEAAEQCGRSDIPDIREPILFATALETYKDKVELLVCEQSKDPKIENWSLKIDQPTGVLVGPEGGWTESELEQFKEAGAGQLNLGQLTLRAETACVAAATKLLT